MLIAGKSAPVLMAARAWAIRGRRHRRWVIGDGQNGFNLKWNVTHGGGQRTQHKESLERCERILTIGSSHDALVFDPLNSNCL